MTEETEKDLEKKMYKVSMPDGSVWAVPVLVIAKDRAEHYMDEFDDDLDKSLLEDTLPLFRERESEIEDWARNNMCWADVVDVAVQVLAPSCATDWEEGWANGDVEIE